MEAYLYKYKCPGTWYGNYEGLRNAYTSGVLNDKQAVEMGKFDLKKSNNFKDCAVTLLVKYKLSIEPIKTYAEITKIPFSETKSKKNDLNLD
tara:strand:- start:110 stop:385 length:276 start_codon:yes stop_codon:yes gene_type:complete